MKITWLITGFALAISLGCGGTASRSGPQDRPSPPSGAWLLPATALLPETREIAPGLQVTYYDDFFKRHLDDLPARGHAGRPGGQVPFLDYDFGKEEVFNSGTNRGIGVRLEGLILLSPPGSYRFQAFANDGIRVFLSGQRIIDDPEVHAGRFSSSPQVTVETAGWYPLSVEYFQRKGTAAIQLSWQKPGDGEFAIVPAAAYGHLP